MAVFIKHLLSLLLLATGILTTQPANGQPGPFPTVNRFSDSNDDSLLATVIARYEYAFIFVEVHTEAKNTPSSYHYSRVVYRYHILGYSPKKARLMLVTSEYLKKKQRNRIRKSGHRVDKTLAKNFFAALDSSGFMYLSPAILNDKWGPVRADGSARYLSVSDAGSTDALAKTPEGVAFYQCDYPASLIEEFPEKSEQRVIFLNVLNRFFVEFLGWPGHFYRLEKKE